MNAAAKERQRRRWGTPSPQHESVPPRSPTLSFLKPQTPAARSEKSFHMSRRTYAEDGGEDDWNSLSDPAFDPNSEEYGPTESPARRGRRGRGGGGRRGRGEGSMGGGRGQHPQGDIIAVTPRARGAVSNQTAFAPPATRFAGFLGKLQHHERSHTISTSTNTRSVVENDNTNKNDNH